MVCPKCGTINNYNELRCRSCYYLLSNSPVADRPVRTIFQTPLRQASEPILKTTGDVTHPPFDSDDTTAADELIDDTTAPNPSIELPFRKREDVEVVTPVLQSRQGLLTAKMVVFIGLAMVVIVACAAAFAYFSTARDARAHAMFAEAEKVFANGNYSTAQALYQQFIGHYPKNKLAVTARQRIDAIRKRFNEQKRQQQTRQIQVLMAQAQQAFAKQQFTVPEHDNVILHTGRILEIDPTHPEALVLQAKVVKYYQDRAEIAFKRRQYRSAQRYYSQILPILPSDAKALARLKEIEAKGIR